MLREDMILVIKEKEIYMKNFCSSSKWELDLEREDIF